MGPNVVIKHLPDPWPGLGGNNFLGYFSLRVTNTFLEGWSSFPSAFLLGAPFLTTLGANKDAYSFPFSFSSFLCAVVNAFTNALYILYA